jgi:hypothetical protein
MQDFRPQGLTRRLYLKFPQRTVRIAQISFTKLEVKLVDIGESIVVQGGIVLEWPHWDYNPDYGVKADGVIERIANSWEPKDLEKLLTDRLIDTASPPIGEQFNGYLTVDHGRFAVTDGYTVIRLMQTNGDTLATSISQLTKAPVVRGNYFYGPPNGKPLYKNVILSRPYTLVHCWATEDGLPLIRMEEFLGFIDRHSEQVADPFRWSVPQIDTSRQQFGGNMQNLMSVLGKATSAYDNNLDQGKEVLVLQEEEIPWPKF